MRVILQQPFITFANQEIYLHTGVMSMQFLHYGRSQHHIAGERGLYNKEFIHSGNNTAWRNE